MRERQQTEKPNHCFSKKRRTKESIHLQRRRTPVQKIMHAAEAGKQLTLSEEDVGILSEMAALQAVLDRDEDDDILREEITGRTYREG